MELTEKKEFDLLSLGEIMLRLSPPDNERITRGDSFSKQAGGAELNAITGAAMLGLRCGIISKLPANDLGVYIKNRVRLCGVSDDYLVYDDDKDARLGVYYYENGAYPRKPRIVYDRGIRLRNCFKYFESYVSACVPWKLQEGDLFTPFPNRTGYERHRYA